MRTLGEVQTDKVENKAWSGVGRACLVEIKTWLAEPCKIITFIASRQAHGQTSDGAHGLNMDHDEDPTFSAKGTAERHSPVRADWKRLPPRPHIDNISILEKALHIVILSTPRSIGLRLRCEVID